MKKFLALLLSVLMVGSVAAFAADDVMPIAADPATAEPVDVATDTAETPEAFRETARVFFERLIGELREEKNEAAGAALDKA